MEYLPGHPGGHPRCHPGHFFITSFISPYPTHFPLHGTAPPSYGGGVSAGTYPLPLPSPLCICANHHALQRDALKRRGGVAVERPVDKVRFREGRGFNPGYMQLQYKKIPVWRSGSALLNPVFYTSTLLGLT